jgi:outer membrane protein TolC
MTSNTSTLLTARVTLMSVFLLSGCAVVSPPLTGPQVAGFTMRLAEELETTPEPLQGLLTVDEAVVRATKYNYAVRAKEREAALAESRVRVESGSMLPSIVAESDYYRRDRPQLSHSSQSQSYSTSADTRTVSRDIALSWNILDFGLSFVRARQGLDKAHQQQEEARRVTSRIIEETRSIYWRAVALETVLPALPGLDKEVEAAMKVSRAAANNSAIDPMEPINYQRELLNLRRELNELLSSLAGATDRLKQTIGSSSNDRLLLEKFPKLDRRQHIHDSVDDDVSVALMQRAEIRQQIYEMRITADEVTTKILQVLPGITFSKTASSDSNSYLFHGNWVSWGVKIADNLINLVRLPSELNAVEAQQAVNRQNALDVAATIVMQVHVARAGLAVQKRAYRDAQRFANVQKQLLQQVRTAVSVGKVGRQALAREKLAALLANVRATVAFAELEAAKAAYATARGDAVDVPEAKAEPQSIAMTKGASLRQD